MSKETIADIVKAREAKAKEAEAKQPEAKQMETKLGDESHGVYPRLFSENFFRRERADSSVAEPSNPIVNIKEVNSSPEPESELSLPIRTRAAPDLPREFLRLNPSTDLQRTTPRAAVLRPFRTDYLPPRDPEAPLFLPADARRHWFLGNLFAWKYWKHKTIQFWKDPGCQAVFNEIEDYHVDPPRPTDLVEPLEESQRGCAKLEDYFRREVLEVVEKVYNTVLISPIMKEECGDIVPQGLWTEKAAENEHLAAKGVKPTFIIRAKSASGENQIRLIGHVEYMGGRSGALTLAIKGAATNEWGSLRCVLGDIARWMLECDTQYGFLITSDEIMFIHFAPTRICSRVSANRDGSMKRVEWVSSMVKPDLYYTEPMRHGDVLNEQNLNVPIRLALLHLVHTTTISEFKMIENKGNCAGYFPVTEAGKKFRP